MYKFFCNPSYPILFNNASSFSDNSVSDSICNTDEQVSSAEELYDFFFNDNYQNQLEKK